MRIINDDEICAYVHTTGGFKVGRALHRDKKMCGKKGGDVIISGSIAETFERDGVFVLSHSAGGSRPVQEFFEDAQAAVKAAQIAAAIPPGELSVPVVKKLLAANGIPVLKLNDTGEVELDK